MLAKVANDPRPLSSLLQSQGLSPKPLPPRRDSAQDWREKLRGARLASLSNQESVQDWYEPCDVVALLLSSMQLPQCGAVLAASQAQARCAAGALLAHAPALLHRGAQVGKEVQEEEA